MKIAIVILAVLALGVVWLCWGVSRAVREVDQDGEE